MMAELCLAVSVSGQDIGACLLTLTLTFGLKTMYHMWKIPTALMDVFNHTYFPSSFWLFTVKKIEEICSKWVLAWKLNTQISVWVVHSTMHYL